MTFTTISAAVESLSQKNAFFFALACALRANVFVERFATAEAQQTVRYALTLLKQACEHQLFEVEVEETIERLTELPDVEEIDSAKPAFFGMCAIGVVVDALSVIKSDQPESSAVSVVAGMLNLAKDIDYLVRPFRSSVAKKLSDIEAQIEMETIQILEREGASSEKLVDLERLNIPFAEALPEILSQASQRLAMEKPS